MWNILTSLILFVFMSPDLILECFTYLFIFFILGASPLQPRSLTQRVVTNAALVSDLFLPNNLFSVTTLQDKHSLTIFLVLLQRFST